MDLGTKTGCAGRTIGRTGKTIGCAASVFATTFAISLLTICSAAAFCQQSSQNANAGSSPADSQSQTDSNAGKKSSSGDNAFPEAQSEAAAKSTAQQSQPSTPQANVPPNANSSSGQKKSSTSQDNPFPEAQSKAAAKADSDSPEPSTNASSGKASSGSASSGYSSSDAKLPPTDLGQGDYRSHEKLDSFTRDQTLDGRIEDDLKVAALYMGNGNYRGALLRYQDAIQYDPGNEVAMFGIANAMCKENLTAEAMARFKSYAKSNPQGKYAMKAEKMLEHPNKCMHNF